MQTEREIDAAADALNRARYQGGDGMGLPERGVSEEDDRAREYSYRLARAALAAAERIREQEIIEKAPECLKLLGIRLADILDADHWNNVEPLLLTIGERLKAQG